MKERIKNIILSPSVLIACLLVLLIAVSFNTKGTTANNSTYPSDDVVNNLAAVMIREIGCGGMGSQSANKEVFVYQMTWVNTVVNQYNFWFESSKTPSTVVFDADNLCKILARGGRGGSYNPDYCADAIDEDKEFSKCESYEVEQLKLAVKMVLRKNFNIPKNVYYAAQKYITHYVGYNLKTDTYEREKNIAEFQCYRTYTGGSPYYPGGDTRDIRKVCFTTQDTDSKLSTKDLYGNTISTDFNFYKNLADCLYEHPNLNNAYNQCDGTVPTEPTKYTVYLYPNGGTGISEGQAFEYTGTADFETFPRVTKENCELDGWNVGSPDGKEYYSNVDSTDDGKKLYARWDCEVNTALEHTVTFKLEKDTNEVFEEKKVTTGKKVSPPTNEPTKENYVLQGWETDDGEVFNFNNKITKDLTLYAIWQKKTSTVPKTEEPKPSSSIPTTPKPTESQSKEDVNNPGTGLADYIIIVLLIIPALLGVIYYYKYYIKSNRES